jgi:hypothetical protein
MTTARAQILDASVTRWHYCLTRCVRRASLLGEGATDRKRWVETRLEEQARTFAIAVGAFAVTDSEVHILVRLDPELADDWSDEEVVRRWGSLFPPQDRARKPLLVTDDWIRGRAGDTAWVAQAKSRLQSLGWFMKSLKEPLSRMINRQEQTRGSFFEGRFKSVAILDDASLAAACISIDLNPVAAGLVALPKAGKYTSIRQRVIHARSHDEATGPRAAKPRRPRSAGPEDSHWLCPIEDRRRFGSAREGMFDGLTLENYLGLAEYTARVFRTGKTPAAPELAPVFARLETDADAWQARLVKLSDGRLLGRFFAASRGRLREVAEHLGVAHLANLAGCSAITDDANGAVESDDGPTSDRRRSRS